MGVKVTVYTRNDQKKESKTCGNAKKDVPLQTLFY